MGLIEPPKVEKPTEIFTCTTLDLNHIIKEINTTASGDVNFFLRDPIGVCRWDYIGADFNNPVFPIIKKRAEAGHSFLQPDIPIPLGPSLFNPEGFKETTNLIGKAFVKPTYRKLVACGSKPSGSRQGYMVMARVYASPRW